MWARSSRLVEERAKSVEIWPRYESQWLITAQVEFVIKEADADGNGELDREEVMASLALWTKLLKSTQGEEEDGGDKSSLCSVM